MSQRQALIGSSNNIAMNKLICVLCALLYIAGSHVSAASLSESRLLAEADSAYDAKNYNLALQTYDSVANGYGTSAPLFFNMACAWYESGNVGMARLYLERALRLDPSDSRIRKNLEFVSMKIEDANVAALKGKAGNVKPDDPGFVDSIVKAVCVDRTTDYWAWLAAMSFVLLVAAAALYLFTANVAARKVGFFGGILLLCFSIVFLAFALKSASYYETHEEGVVTAFNVELLTEPSPDSKPISSPLVRGTKMSVVGTETGTDGKTDWYRVRLNRSVSGWLKAEDFEII